MASLEADIQRDHDVLAVFGGGVLVDTARNGRTLLASLGGILPRRTPEDLLVLQLEPGDAVAVDIAHADDLTAQIGRAHV